MAEITLGRYLFERLRQLEVNTIFGLPGDFNLTLLDNIYDVKGLRWAGNANELNAAYAADGYARVKGLACLVTTFGVGELSALNGVAGAYAEHVGLLHVVGTPSVTSQAKQLLLHHTLGNGDFTVFHRMSNNISSTSAFLSDIRSAPAEIDRCIREAYINQRPVYVGLPANLVDLTVPASLLDTPIDLSLYPNPKETEEEAVEAILRLVENSTNPIIVVDACCSRHRCKEEARKLVEVTQFPVFSTPLGKGTIDEGGVGDNMLIEDASLVSKLEHRLKTGNNVSSRFGGVYVGSLSEPHVKEMVESADLVLSIGALLSDYNTGSFSYNYKTRNIVEFHTDCTKVKQATFPDVQMKPILQTLIKKIGSVSANYKPQPVPKVKLVNTPAPKSAKLAQDWLWTRVSSWFREGDIIITETGTSSFGIIQAKFPNNTIGISQVLWGSIGYTTGATLGAVMAAEEIDPKKRVILFIGDGSLQLTVQEISTMVRWNLKPYLFVLNNDGYTIERLIHGENASYNDIQPWNNLQLLPLFNAKDYEATRISTVGEAEELLGNKDFGDNSKIRMIEVMLPRLDASKNLIRQAEMSAEANRS
ncbi:Piso0_002524 [Millerozyma farinosa CBS 7064]|uniref:Piso0_002524 protein n=1 Tax=Pichia sorbitophila (strain ATCC MYA-4447 / BCRC 22081 / CBS 7064 / NBRC 10061 / NRRL Y-12695) TaxID=559304 RepID=G8YCU7_PICSO|nr:Piso0_002524 [Millerozyma farinosa CBS 7064]